MFESNLIIMLATYVRHAILYLHNTACSTPATSAKNNAIKDFNFCAIVGSCIVLLREKI